MTSPWQPPVYNPSSIPALAPPYNLTTDEVTTLSRLASAAKATAYCPYSRFRVGATLLTTDGQYFSGANVENASYPVGTCAERVALAKAVVDLAAVAVAGEAAGEVAASGGRGGFGLWKTGQVDGVPRGFKALAVATDISPPASPCGMCRQLWVVPVF
jgi:cytidine deaminase